MSDDERPKRSWSEIDKLRDKSTHRRDPRPEPGMSGARRERSQKSYRAALDRAFSSGAIGKLLDEPGAQGEGDGRARELAAIRNADTPEDVSAAVDRALAAGPLPDDIEIWARVVEHRDMLRVREALLRVAALLDEHPLKRARALRSRLRYLEEIAEDEEIRVLATKLRSRLPG